MRILHAAAELFPWVKVGGLGDVMGALPEAQRAIGLKARMLLPALAALFAGGNLPDRGERWSAMSIPR